MNREKKRERGYCLVSQQIRMEIINGKISLETNDFSLDKNGRFVQDSLEKRVQPSSFEPVIGEEIFILDIEKQAVFSPGSNQTVYRALLELPRRQRSKVNISGGFETICGFNYLIPLTERIRLFENESLRSSPKSSIGRLFPYTRLVSDYSSCFDSIDSRNISGREIQMWLLFQPTAFNIIIHPGLSLNQLRFFCGLDASLSQQELIGEFNRNPLFYQRNDDGSLSAVMPVITNDGMQMNIDLTGQHTQRIVALRARKNPIAIDISKEGHYDAEDYYEPVFNSGGKVKFFGGERILIASEGVLSIPSHLSAELRRFSGVSIRGSWDEAGFADNGFNGDLNFEATLNETGGMTLDSRIALPVSFLEFFRTSEVPDKIYGREIGSHYHEQLGVRPPKYFKEFDFSFAARIHKKLDKDVLVHDSSVLRSFRQVIDGFESITSQKAEELIKEIEENGFFHSRYDCEDDTQVLQVIPYTIVFGPNKIAYSYVRSSDIIDYGERKLFGRHSIGFGGHILTKDHPNYISKGQKRELQEEIKFNGRRSKRRIVGTIFSEETLVDRVHFGLVYVVHVDNDIESNERSAKNIQRETFEDLTHKLDHFETWSRILIPYLPLLYRS